MNTNLTLPENKLEDKSLLDRIEGNLERVPSILRNFLASTVEHWNGETTSVEDFSVIIHCVNALERQVFTFPINNRYSFVLGHDVAEMQLNDHLALAIYRNIDKPEEVPYTTLSANPLTYELDTVVERGEDALVNIIDVNGHSVFVVYRKALVKDKVIFSGIENNCFTLHAGRIVVSSYFSTYGKGTYDLCTTSHDLAYAILLEILADRRGEQDFTDPLLIAQSANYLQLLRAHNAFRHPASQRLMGGYKVVVDEATVKAIADGLKVTDDSVSLTYKGKEINLRNSK